MGVNSAGQVFLKSMFYLKDGSMVLLVTARGHRSDGSVFSFDGLAPDVRADQQGDDLIKFAARYLMEKRLPVTSDKL
jgi:C-terminal processing protease CtpA/Prc